MISILIPVYNTYVKDSAHAIHKQAIKLCSDFEIIVADDASDTAYHTFNKTLNELPYCTYIRLEKNIGRSKIRNFLADEAQFPYLIFTDGDTLPFNSSFIKNYLSHSKSDVVFGGISYTNKPPEKQEEYLRWYYGKHREEIAPEERKKQGNRLFMTGNFFIRKEKFNIVKFNEEFKLYGHEDSLFAFELAQNGISVSHINNPVYHLGLETAEEFLKKTLIANQNLFKIAANPNHKALLKTVRLWRYYERFKVIGFIIRPIYKLLKPVIKKNLKSKNPKLFLFDFYKLGNLFLHKNGQ